jgi:hypothetical protein
MTDEVNKAERICSDLQDQRQKLLDKIKTLGEQREQVSYAAHTGDKAAKAKLDRINVESSTIGHEVVGVEAAIAEADRRLAAARKAEALALDHERATQIAELSAKFKEELGNADDALSDAVSSILEARKLLEEMHTLGVTSPTDAMFRINAVAVLKTSLQLLPNAYVNDFEFMRLAPSQKKSFRPLADAWGATIANQIAARLPTDKDERAA